jgi:L-arabinokinase
MGGIADYSGSLVLQMPIAEETRCTIEMSDTRVVEVESSKRDRPFAIGLDRILRGGDLGGHEALRDYFWADPATHWASYIVGVIQVMALEEGLILPSGVKIYVDSDVPEGKGVSSSAALEVAVMRACLHLIGAELDSKRLALLCQMAENHVAGAPCGIMDQMTASCGEPGRLMKLLCQPAELTGFVDLPPGLQVWGIDSGVQHAVSGSEYSTVRAAARMGERMLERALGEGDNPFGGFLANAGSVPDALRLAKELPVSMSGTEFLKEHGGISDDVVEVEADVVYPVRAATLHPIVEHERISRFARLLEVGDGSEKTLAMAGELMYLSHVGYSSCGLGSPGTDRLVEMVRGVGYRAGLFGARITGGGSGGSVAVLGRGEAFHHLERIAATYEQETGLSTQVFET